MLHFRVVSILALTSGACLCLSAGCGSDTSGNEATTAAASTSTTSGAGGAGGSGGGGGQGGQGAAPSCSNGDDTVLVAEKVYLGDEDFEDTPDELNAWKIFGKDLDGMVTTSDFTGHCLPAAGGDTLKLVDGDAGIDNAFGHNILPILIGLAPNFTAKVNEPIQNGDATLMLKLDDLGLGTDQDPVVTKLYQTAQVKQGICWPVTREQLDDPTDIESPATIFMDSAVAGNVWTSGSPVTAAVTLNFAGYPITLTIKHARLSMELKPNHTGANLGQVGGVLDTEEFITAFKQVIGTVDASFCEGTTFESISNQIRQSSDIMTDGTQDPAATCNGISIGFGFRMEAAKIAGIAQPASPIDMPCP